MVKLKVIMIAHASHSYFAGEGDDLKSITLNDWYAKTSGQLKKFHPEIDVECWAPEKEDKKESNFKDSGILFRFFPTTLSPLYGLDFSVLMLKELKKEVKKSKKENYKLVIHLHEVHNLHGLLIATIFSREKIIVQHHGGSWPLKHLKESGKKRFFFPLFLLGQWWENKVLKDIKVFYFLSPQEKEYLKKVAPNSKIVFQTMGIDDFYFDFIPKRKAGKIAGWSGNKKVLLFVGRVNDVKGIPYLLDAATELKDTEIKIIGWGEIERYKKEVSEKDLNNVEFLGGVFGKDKLKYLSAADAFILPSTKEGASVSVMEALARNLPVITTDVAGMPLMVHNEKEGYVIPQKNSKEIVNAVKKIMKWKNRNVIRYANKYKWKKIIEDTVEDYRRI